MFKNEKYMEQIAAIPGMTYHQPGKKREFIKNKAENIIIQVGKDNLSTILTFREKWQGERLCWKEARKKLRQPGNTIKRWKKVRLDQKWSFLVKMQNNMCEPRYKQTKQLYGVSNLFYQCFTLNTDH